MKLSELVYQDESRNNRSCRVGDRDADPYAKCSDHRGRINKQGTRNSICRVSERKIAFLDIPMGKEKVCRHHLETDNRKDRKDDMQTVHRRLDQLRIGRKHADDHRREQLTEQKPCCRHPYRPLHRQLRHFRHTRILAGTEVITGNRLHPLVEPHDDHNKEEYHPVHDPYAPIAISPPCSFSPRLISITIRQAQRFIRKGDIPI